MMADLVSQPRVLCIGGTALETRVEPPYLTSGPLTESFASIEDRLGGSGWFLSVGALAEGASVSLPCRIGSDATGRQVKMVARACGVRLLLTRVEKATSRFVVWTPDAEGPTEPIRFTVEGEAPPWRHKVRDYEGICIGYVTDATAHEVCGAINRLKSKPLLAFSPSGSILRYQADILAEVLALATFTSLNKQEYEQLKRADRLLRTMCEAREGSHLVITDGSDPLKIFRLSEGRFEEIGRFKPPSVVGRPDTIGCGDILAGSAISLLCRGHSIADTFARAARNAAIATQCSDPLQKIGNIRESLDGHR
jgi:sugar/nucleoside kinase (ribokinase family)